MKRMLVMILVLVVGPSLGFAGEAGQVANDAVVALDEAGTPIVLLRYDATEFFGHHVHNAVLEWVLPTMPNDRTTEYAVYPVMAPWSVASVNAERLPKLGEDPLDMWDFTPNDYQRSGRSIIRLQVHELVRGWSTGEANYGLAIVSADFDRASVSAMLNQAKLRVWHEKLD